MALVIYIISLSFAIQSAAIYASECLNIITQSTPYITFPAYQSECGVNCGVQIELKIHDNENINLKMFIDELEKICYSENFAISW